ncbi:MAG: hypothetical protein ONA90_09150 [candidate division KSB1 bacterium]|nr:hypothetical protein [candidate division KSB1 bacterium]
MPFKILTDRLPKKWQAELRETLGVAAPSADPKAAEASEPISVNSEDAQAVETVLRWIQRMNRQQQSTKPAANSFPNQGISITIERADGSRIRLTERNAGVVKQFLASKAEGE